ncbi:MAG: hypothetical protein PUI84_04095, partial [Bacteroidales bacterium]|nr:hypothetical protein [Bacteroidales bacterium]
RIGRNKKTTIPKTVIRVLRIMFLSIVFVVSPNIQKKINHTDLLVDKTNRDVVQNPTPTTGHLGCVSASQNFEHVHRS